MADGAVLAPPGGSRLHRERLTETKNASESWPETVMKITGWSERIIENVDIR
jgi:hypothetical protein